MSQYFNFFYFIFSPLVGEMLNSDKPAQHVISVVLILASSVNETCPPPNRHVVKRIHLQCSMLVQGLISCRRFLWPTLTTHHHHHHHHHVLLSSAPLCGSCRSLSLSDYCYLEYGCCPVLLVCSDPVLIAAHSPPRPLPPTCPSTVPLCLDAWPCMHCTWRGDSGWPYWEEERKVWVVQPVVRHSW